MWIRILGWFKLHEVQSVVVVSRSRETETERFKTMQIFFCSFFRSECIGILSLLRNRLHGGAPRRGATGHHLFRVLQRHNSFSRISSEEDWIWFSQSSSGLSANRVQNSFRMRNYICLFCFVSQFINRFAAGSSASYWYTKALWPKFVFYSKWCERQN